MSHPYSPNGLGAYDENHNIPCVCGKPKRSWVHPKEVNVALAADIARAREDREFMERLRRRAQEDKPILDRLGNRACPSTALAVLGAVDPKGSELRCGLLEFHPGLHHFEMSWSDTTSPESGVS